MIVIGNGVVVDPKVLLQEIDGLAERGVDVSRLRISGDAHLIMPHHRALDQVVERYLGSRPHRHHRPGHRPGLRGQGRPDGHPAPGPARPGHPA